MASEKNLEEHREKENLTQATRRQSESTHMVTVYGRNYGALYGFGIIRGSRVPVSYFTKYFII